MDMPDPNLDLEAFWAELRPGLKSPSEKPESSEREVAPWVCSWASTVGQGASPILVLGESDRKQLEVYESIEDPAYASMNASKWVTTGLVANLTQRISKLKMKGSLIPHDWDLIWSLLTLSDVNIERNDALRALLDQGSMFTEAFRAIWEAKFLFNEGQIVAHVVDLLSKWVSNEALTSEDRELLGQLKVTHEVTTPSGRLDVLFMLMTLANQNDLLDRLVLPLEGLDKILGLGLVTRKVALEELYEFFLAADRWARLGSPVGFIFTYTRPDTLEQLGRSHRKLGKQLKRLTREIPE
jgi:hypothetical protein